jgi:lysine-specific demethylase 3
VVSYRQTYSSAPPGEPVGRVSASFLNNICLTKGKLQGAVWDIYSADDSATVRKYLDMYSLRTLNQLSGGKWTQEDYDRTFDNPIHGQQYYIDEAMRRELAGPEYNVKSWRIYQRPGDAVFIPAG